MLMLVFQYSNTSHVILYRIRSQTPQSASAFKYISCYSLSKLRLTLRIRFRYSNTSHVILYREKGVIRANRRTAFKYISCYSLSPGIFPVYERVPYSNTSHVILYHVKNAAVAAPVIDSNTSHVILYRACKKFVQSEGNIQIHLMLFFIEQAVCIPGNGKPFKYISCYSLSSAEQQTVNLDTHSNTSHVILYPDGARIQIYNDKFKYISCYSLSHAFPPFPTLLYLKPPYISIFYHFLPAVSVFLPNSLFLPHIPCIFGILSNFPLFIAW